MIQVSKVILTFTIGFIFLTSCTKTPKEAKDPRSEEVKAVISNYYEVMSDRDWESYRNLFWENGTITTRWNPDEGQGEKVVVSTISEFIEQTPEGPDSQPIFEEKMTSFDVSFERNIAVVWADYDAKFGTEADLLEWSGTDCFALMFHDNEWKIVSLVFSSD